MKSKASDRVLSRAGARAKQRKLLPVPQELPAKSLAHMFMAAWWMAICSVIQIGGG